MVKLESDKRVVCGGSCSECVRCLRLYLCEDRGGISAWRTWLNSRIALPDSSSSEMLHSSSNVKVVRYHTLSVFCSCAAVALLIVNVIDVNDERPRFLASSYSFHVLENQAAGSLVGVVSARDDDGAPYNQLSLSLLPGGSLSDAFSIDRRDGRLLTTRPLDRERQVSIDSLF